MTTKIEPGWAILPGRLDPLLLHVVWFARKSFYWVTGLGLMLGGVEHRSNVAWGFDSPSAVAALIALGLRLGSTGACLALAYPFCAIHEHGLAPRTNFGKSIGLWLDRLHIAKAYKELRWSHHIRQAALDQLGSLGDRLRKVDPVLDVVNIASITIGVLTFAVIGPAAG